MARQRRRIATRAEESPPGVEGYRCEADLLAEEVLRGDCVLFVGAGVSADALPKWSELVDMLGRALPELGAKGSTPGDFLDIAQWYVEEHGRARLLREVVRIYGAPHVRSTPLAAAVASLPANILFTTNYDRVLEMALRQRYNVPDAIVDDRHIALVDERNRTTVIKMHGCISRPESIVLTREDYATYGETHRAMITYLQSLLATRTFLFVGFSFSDPNFRFIYEAIQRALGRYRRQAYALILDPQNPLMVRHWERNGVRMLTFSRGQGGRELLGFVEALGERVQTQQDNVGFAKLLSALAADTPPPPFPEAAELAELLQRAGRLAKDMLRYAAQRDYLRTALPDVPMPGESVAGTGEKITALYRLVSGLEGLGLNATTEDWARLGNELYLSGDLASAVRAYNTAIRRRVKEAGGRNADDEISHWVLGNLARAYIGLKQYSRAEGLLRELVLHVGEAGLELNEGWLRRRSSDLSELGHVTNLIAEQMVVDGHHEQAADVLGEVGPWLEDGLTRGLFGSPTARPRGREEAAATRAYALNALGHNHRLRHEIAAHTGDVRAARRHYENARQCLEESLAANPYLADSWADLLAMHGQNLLDDEAAPARVADLRARLENLAGDELGRGVRNWVRERCPEAWPERAPAGREGTDGSR